jgi:hypothetical protein
VTPVLTLFTATARLDLGRVWLACVTRAFAGERVAIEVFAESESVLESSHLRGATLLGPGPSRRDYQEALNDALRRAATPYLAFVDTDVFWTSAETWRRVLERFEDGRCAAVSCVSRTATEGHGTFAVVLRVAPYRDALAGVPGGFCAAAEEEKTDGAPGRWAGPDTGDLLFREVVARGGRVDLLHLDAEGAFVKFDALTCTQLLLTWAGARPVLALARRNPYIRDGVLGNLALAGAYGRLFPEGPPFEFPMRLSAALRALGGSDPRELARAAARYLTLRTGARRVARFLSADRPA